MSISAITRNGRVFSKDVKTLDVTINPNVADTNRKPTSAILGRLCSIVARYCEKVQITLRIVKARCFDTPICNFERGNFPNVTTLVLNVGHPKYIPDVPSGNTGFRTSNIPVVMSQRSIRFNAQQAYQAPKICRPDKKFWATIFNGLVFPDIQNLQIYHVVDGDISALERRRRQSGYSQELPSAKLTLQEEGMHRDYFGMGYDANITFHVGELISLEKLKCLVIAEAPELNAAILLGTSQFARALTRLELRNCHLSLSDLYRFLPLALPQLTQFTLHVTSTPNTIDVRREINHSKYIGYSVENPPHLCIVLREYGKHLDHLEYHSPYVCQELFLDPAECQLIPDAGGWNSVSGGYHGEGIVHPHDKFQLERLISTHREKKAELELVKAVEQKKIQFQADFIKRQKNKQINSGTCLEFDDDRIVRQIQQEQRRIRDKTRIRRIVSTFGMCRKHELWDALGILATFEDEGVEWFLGSERLLRAGRFYKGQLAREDLDFDVVFAGKVESSEPHLQNH